MADDKTFTQADVDAAIEKAMGPLKESVDKLTTKNEELIGENRKLKRAGEIKPEDLTAAEERADKAETKAADLEKQVRTLTGERDKAVKALEGETGYTSKLLIQDGIKTELLKNGIKDEDFIDSLTAKFASQAAVKVDGDTRTAMIGDKSLADAIKEFAGSDSGKKFVEAANNGGGGAQGGKGASSGKTMSEADFNALNPKARSAFMSEGGTIADQAA